ncbi:unnamed protein product, partial [Nesidiocoris tenuis]
MKRERAIRSEKASEAHKAFKLECPEDTLTRLQRAHGPSSASRHPTSLFSKLCQWGEGFVDGVPF